MREGLVTRNGRRGKFTAVVSRFGQASGWQGRPLKTVLLTDVRDESGATVTDHLWFKVGTWSAELKPGDKVSFEARVRSYKKGYRGYREDDELPPPSVDYRLAFPSKVRKITDSVSSASPMPAADDGGGWLF